MAATEVKYSPGIKLPNSLYLDSNILITFLDRNHVHHAKSSQFVVEALAYKTKFYLSPLVLDEVWYALMRCWHRESVGNKLDSKNKNHIKLYGTRIRQVTEDLLKLFQPVLLPLSHRDPQDSVQSALQLLAEEGLAPRDSYHLAYTITSGVAGFATFDGGFLPLDSPALTLSIIRVL
jgi:predicted nucleic acid-binding protein